MKKIIPVDFIELEEKIEELRKENSQLKDTIEIQKGVINDLGNRLATKNGLFKGLYTIIFKNKRKNKTVSTTLPIKETGRLPLKIGDQIEFFEIVSQKKTKK